MCIRDRFKKEAIMFISLTLVSVLIAFNLKSFVRTGGLFPGGFSGLTILLQQIADVFFHIKIDVYKRQMQQYPKPLARLVNELSKLPGIGSKTAQRLAFHILSLDDSEAQLSLIHI